MEETIAAIATPFGEGGIGIIRMSGEESLKIVKDIFVPASGKPLTNRMLTYGHVYDDEKNVIDEVMAVFMKAPKTYTREDVVEINCHGGVVPVQKILSLILSKGARLAEPGEFTKRAFLNGRLDLTQAEAVIDLISAKAEKTFDVAMKQLEGVVSGKIRECREALTDVLVNLTVNIDYPDEDIEEITYKELAHDLETVLSEIKLLLAGFDTGRILKEGLRVAIIGKPNVGKSSLMNALLKESRAIVTDIPGTTRDTIEENLSIRGIPVVLTDTAGIRETEDYVEAMGIERSKESFNRADLIIMVMDGSGEIENTDLEIIEKLDPVKSVILLNKNDLATGIAVDDVKRITPNGETEVISVSMKKTDDILRIEEILLERICLGKVTQQNSAVITNVRQKNLLDTAALSLSDAIEATYALEPLEVLEIDVKEAYLALGEILGEETAENILEEVFSRFCLGK
ncbi:tRNA uridine(34) 5-carboxymethylaminomethyl synthesis GTPase MnmE [Eubacterium minutum ATCC 700079]|nr:tRNA uridine(34) 5-carboxymethylaminomethyl synthesis GTPase MnmE [Eubacterium minutum ATCC 700079]